ncbi:MAG: shikimate dehydrogenase [Ilumatobacteraceae bacterium]|nr:shikimate dehydrogenase [Ilumatobacteraceae bacterium]
MSVAHRPVAAVIGSPIRQSLSPAIFNAAFAQAGDERLYVGIDVDLESVQQAVSDAIAQNFIGLSVTMPLKEAVIDSLDEIDPVANTLRAVNSIRIVHGRTYGFNTDGDGCCDALVAKGNATIKGAQAVVLGAGGTARSVALALACRGASVKIINRTSQNAQRAVELVRAHPDADTFDVDIGNEQAIALATIVVNCTSVGMSSTEVSLIDAQSIRPDAVVLDAVYQPLQTELLRSAQARGCTVVDGLWMLIYQAARQHEAWCGTIPDVSVMRTAAKQELSRREQ